MQFRRPAMFVALLTGTLLAMTSLASAGAYTAVITYGDSLSDNGNLFAASGNTYPPPPYWNGRFSNGPVAVEYLANALHAPLVDLAWGGATTGIGNIADGGTQTSLGLLNVPGMIPEVLGTPSSVWAIAPTSLFVVWGGGNDYFQTPTGSVSTAVGDMLWIISQLQAAGAQHILVPGLPDLGLSPNHFGDPSATLFSLAFNAGLQANLPKGVTYFDTFGYVHQVVANPGTYGFTDVTDPCFNGVTVCANPNQYLFWDGDHPTTAADAILAGQFEKAVTPEPSTFLMLGTGFVGLAGMLRRKLF